jgi:hypothetical protein
MPKRVDFWRLRKEAALDMVVASESFVVDESKVDDGVRPGPEEREGVWIFRFG